MLDAADALRAKRREALAQLDTLLQSIFLAMFGDPVTNPMRWETTALACIIREGRESVTDGAYSTAREPLGRGGGRGRRRRVALHGAGAVAEAKLGEGFAGTGGAARDRGVRRASRGL